MKPPHELPSARTCSRGYRLASILTVVLCDGPPWTASAAEAVAVGAKRDTSNPAPANAKNDASEPKTEGWGITGYPILFYSPETKAALGGGLVLYYERPGLRPDVTELELFATQRKQFEFNLKQTTYFRGNDFLLSAGIGVRRAPDTAFFGVGADTPSSQKEQYLNKAIHVGVAFMTRTRGSLYLGPALSLGGFRADNVVHTGQLARSALTGGRQELAIGAGASMRWDTSDSVFYPTRGFHFGATGLCFREELGSDHSFTQVSFDHRQYFKLLDRHVIALQFLVTLSGGAVPWQKLPMLGGMSMLRGYYEGRYRDRHFAAAQLEYRFPLVWRFGGAAFAAAGEVAPSVSKFSVHTLRTAVGGGLRFTLDRDEHINLRIDVAVTDHGNVEPYISILEAF